MTIYQLTREGYVIRGGDTKVPIVDSPLSPNTNPDFLEYKAWLAAGGIPLPADPEPASAVWDRIKVERDRRAALGVKVGAHWFHSDEKSRIQQLALTSPTLTIPPGLQWKTLTFTPPPVFVTMTRELAIQIVQATAASDTAIFIAAEVHRMAMEASPDPGNYDFSAGWPASIEEEANEAGIAFDARLL
ncbi:MAG: DUF4376 domain-containing protein [Acidovorax sp.]|nr:DUF4376 domain-containing protein [Acidovorax sp.]